jgi:uncharacterized protein
MPDEAGGRRSSEVGVSIVKIVLAGGAGSLGRRIADDLAARGHEMVVLTRRTNAPSEHRTVVWDGVAGGAWEQEVSGAVVVNLAGELVDRPYTTENVELLTRSRVEPTLALAHAASIAEEPPPLWLQMSTLAIYGDRGEAILDETALPAQEPPQMAGVARAWEGAAANVVADRQVVLRTGIVLDRGTPALKRLTGLVHWGLGGRVGDGRQWVSWLHIADFLGIIRAAIDDPSLNGVVHATSPNPVRNTELMATLRKQLHRPWSPPTPTALVHLGAALLRTDPALALTGRRCIPGELRAHDFIFRYPNLSDALADLLAQPTDRATPN